MSPAPCWCWARRTWASRACATVFCDACTAEAPRRRPRLRRSAGGRSAYGLLGMRCCKQLACRGPGAEGAPSSNDAALKPGDQRRKLRLAVFVGELCGVPFPMMPAR